MPTLGEYVEALVVAGTGLGGWFRFVATAEATGPDAARTVIVAGLADDDEGGTGYTQGYLYATDGNVAGEQRRVSAFDGSTESVGRFVAAAPFSGVPAAGVGWEWSAKLPRIQHGAMPGSREIVNQTLRRLWVPARYGFVGTGGGAYPVPWWLRTQSQVGDIYHPAEPNPVRTFRPVLRLDDAEPRLEVPSAYGSTQPFDVLLYRPANSYLKIGGTWAEQAGPLAGLLDDEDEALPPLDDVTPVALAYAYAALAWPHPGTHVAYWEAKAKEQQQLAGAVKALSLPVDASGGRLVTGAGGGGWAKGWSPG